MDNKKVKWHNVYLNNKGFECLIISTHMRTVAEQVRDQLNYYFSVTGESVVVTLRNEFKDSATRHLDVLASISFKLDRVSSERLEAYKEMVSTTKGRLIGTLVSLEMDKDIPFKDLLDLDLMSPIPEMEGLLYIKEARDLGAWISKRGDPISRFDTWLCRREWGVSDPIIASKVIREAVRTKQVVPPDKTYYTKYNMLCSPTLKGTKRSKQHFNLTNAVKRGK